MRWLSAVRLDARGMQRLLGALETDIMEALWSGAERTTPEVYAALGQRVMLNTVTTVLKRLTDKGLVTRTGTRRSYRFRPAVTRDEFVAAVTRQLAEGMVQDFGDLAAVAFTEAARATTPAARDGSRRIGGDRENEGR